MTAKCLGLGALSTSWGAALGVDLAAVLAGAFTGWMGLLGMVAVSGLLLCLLWGLLQHTLHAPVALQQSRAGGRTFQLA